MQLLMRATVLATVTVCLGAGLTASPAGAGDLVFPPLSGEVVWLLGERAVAGAPLGENGHDEGTPFDAALFGQELVAFALKEAFPDAEDEYDGTSGIRGPLDPRPIDVRHRFGDHCLWAVNRLWRTARAAFPGGDVLRVRGADPVRRHGSAIVAGSLLAQGVWTALRNEIVDRRDGMALRPKISARKVALEFKFRW